MSNAIRYHDPGKPAPWVRVRCRTTEAGLDIEVADNGIGIPARHHAEVFGMFNRFSERSGSGLGLSLVKKHVDRLKGKISFESSGEGTSFVLSLPAA
jgi:signal transduction histidine kinase